MINAHLKISGIPPKLSSKSRAIVAAPPPSIGFPYVQVEMHYSAFSLFILFFICVQRIRFRDLQEFPVLGMAGKNAQFLYQDIDRHGGVYLGAKR